MFDATMECPGIERFLMDFVVGKKDARGDGTIMGREQHLLCSFDLRGKKTDKGTIQGRGLRL